MANWRKELRALSRRTPEPGEESAAVSKAMAETETDRGFALIGGSLAEEAIQQIIRLRASQLLNRNVEDIFGFDAPLGSFSSRIKVAFAFGMIDRELRDDFDRVREIRNAFAHSMLHVTFAMPVMKRACEGFHTPSFVSLGIENPNINPARLAYHNACLTLLHVSSMAMEAYGKGWIKKALAMASYDGVAASRDRFLRLAAKRHRQNLRKAGKKTAHKGPP